MMTPGKCSRLLRNMQDCRAQMHSDFFKKSGAWTKPVKSVSLFLHWISERRAVAA